MMARIIVTSLSNKKNATTGEIIALVKGAGLGGREIIKQEERYNTRRPVTLGDDASRPQGKESNKKNATTDTG